MMWFLFQASIIFAVVASNIHWHWTPNGYLASAIGIGLACLTLLLSDPAWKRPWYTSGLESKWPDEVTIYQFTVLDPGRSERRTSRRWGTREGIQSRKDFAQIRILEDTAKEVGESAVNSMGFTRLDFEPAPGRWPRRD